MTAAELLRRLDCTVDSVERPQGGFKARACHNFLVMNAQVGYAQTRWESEDLAATKFLESIGIILTFQCLVRSNL